MKLLICTQVIDQNHPILGFFHRWIEEFAQHCEVVHVICLQEGTHTLPANVTIYSLGKEAGKGRLTYLWRFYSLLWKLRTEYDSVFVHMNQEYILLGALYWRLAHKSISLWRNHYAGSWRTQLAGHLANYVFCTSRTSYTAQFKNIIFMPVGVDVDRFQSNSNTVRVPNSILSLGRLDPSKRIDIMIEAVALLKQMGFPLSMSIVGNESQTTGLYREMLVNLVKERGLLEEVVFCEGRPQREVVRLYQSHQFFINLSPSGMFDKTIFEAAASGCIVLASGDDWKAIVPDSFSSDANPSSVAKKLAILMRDEHDGSLLQNIVERHSLKHLIQDILKILHSGHVTI